MEKFPDIPGYRIIRPLGHGGMARVYLAEQESFGRKVALKIMVPPAGNVNLWAKRFIHEAQVIAQLSHPNIVPVYDVGNHEGQFYISMEFVGGGDLDQAKDRGLTLSRKLKIIVGVAAGLDFAGEKGFVHRDIKPDNVMFRENGSPVILDFGIVKQLDDVDTNMTQTGTVMGTAKYMSPEQAQGQALDQRSDIYSLGIMFYELLTGAAPFQGDSAVATLMMHVNARPAPLPASLSPLQAVIDKCLAKDPEARYPRARKLIEHLQGMEAELKQIISRQQATLVTNPNDATVAVQRDKDDQDKTVASNRTQEIDESELTQVLSSAKATIKDFSAEARAQRARRARMVTAGIGLCAVLSLCYLAYQQLVLVPQEREQAEQKVRLAKEQSLQKIAELFKEVEAIHITSALADPATANTFIALHREILKLEPENGRANKNLEQLGRAFLNKSETAVAAMQIQDAENYLDFAQQLIAGDHGVLAVQESLKQARAALLDSELQNEKIATLLDLAQKDIENSRGFSEEAYTKLIQIQRIDENNARSKALINDMLGTLFRTTKNQIENGRLTQADQGLNALAKYHPDVAGVSELQTAFQTEKRRADSRLNQQSLSKQASRLLREKRSLSINDELREIYLRMLKQDAGSTEAQQGLLDTSRYDAQIASQAIIERDFRRAQEQITLVEKYTPAYAQLDELKARLFQAKNHSQQAHVLLGDAGELIRQASASTERRALLAQATSKIEEARNLDPRHPAIQSNWVGLENAYVNAISTAVSEGDDTLVENYFDDTSGKVWPSERIVNLQIAQRDLQKDKEKQKRKRIVGGGF